MALIDLPFHDLHLKGSSWVVLDSLYRSTALSRRYNRLKPPKRASCKRATKSSPANSTGVKGEYACPTTMTAATMTNVLSHQLCFLLSHVLAESGRGGISLQKSSSCVDTLLLELREIG